MSLIKNILSGAGSFINQATKFSQALSPLNTAVTAISGLFDTKDSGTKYSGTTYSGTQFSGAKYCFCSSLAVQSEGSSDAPQPLRGSRLGPGMADPMSARCTSSAMSKGGAAAR